MKNFRIFTSLMLVMTLLLSVNAQEYVQTSDYQADMGVVQEDMQYFADMVYNLSDEVNALSQQSVIQPVNTPVQPASAGITITNSSSVNLYVAGNNGQPIKVDRSEKVNGKIGNDSVVAPIVMHNGDMDTTSDTIGIVMHNGDYDGQKTSESSVTQVTATSAVATPVIDATETEYSLTPGDEAALKTRVFLAKGNALGWPEGYYWQYQLVAMDPGSVLFQAYLKACELRVLPAAKSLWEK